MADCFAADSRIFGCPASPTNSDVYAGRSSSTIARFVSGFFARSTARILDSCSSLRMPDRTAPSHGMGRWRMLFWSEARYGGGSRNILPR